MSRTDLFAKYTQIYAKARAKEIVPDGTFVRQLLDVPRRSYDVGVFFKSKRSSRIVQVHLGDPIPTEVATQDGFLETEEATYLSRSILSKFKTIDFLRVVISAGEVLTKKEERVEFLKVAQRILDVILKKARNILHVGELDLFHFDLSVRTLDEYLNKELKLDEVSVEAASIPFNVAGPEYILLADGSMIVVGDEPRVPQCEFYLVGGIGYRFDKTEGAISEERLFRSTADLTPQGIDEAYIDGMIQRVTEDFQNKLHSLIFADVWKKGKSGPVGVNFGGDLLVKAEPSSDIWIGVFEVYVKSPKT
ncbi:MAG: hypothetical protein AM325_007815 [Candidatus Thorarchaeota archaeon SMTZ1-45]|nr:MAG: hypothetical protein AM325_09535 [Candidatus Thorarchaeota archaeon SMTZ1-45]